MHYFVFERNRTKALLSWKLSQFDLCDIVLSLTDNKIKTGIKIYELFTMAEVKAVLPFFICDFKKIKADLQILDYVERKGDVYSKNFNPKRLYKITTPKPILEENANKVYINILNDLEKIAHIATKNNLNK